MLGSWEESRVCGDGIREQEVQVRLVFCSKGTSPDISVCIWSWLQLLLALGKAASGLAFQEEKVFGDTRLPWLASDPQE